MKVAFAHNVYNRFKTLKETIDVERGFFPESEVFVGCNSYVNDLFFSQLKNVYVKYYVETPEHKIGCVNGLMLACNMALEKDFDVLIFSHDDVRLSPRCLGVVNEHINSVFENKCDIVYRNAEWYGNDYAMMEVVYMNRKAVETLFSNISLLKNEEQIDRYYFPDGNSSICPELWFYKKIKSSNLNANVFKYPHDSPQEYNIRMPFQVGFEHLRVGVRGWTD